MSRPAAPCDPPLEGAGTEVAGRDGRRIHLADLLLRLMATMPERLGGRPLPRVVAVTASSDSIGLLLSEPRDDPATGFEAIDGGLTWISEPSVLVEVTTGDRERGVPWPLLVSLGHIGPDGPVVMVNLEELGATELSGEPADVLAFAESLAAELASDRFAGHPRVVCVNCAWQLEALTGVRVVKSLRQALADAEAHEARLRASGVHRAKLPELRRHFSRDVPEPLAIIDPHGHDPEARARLARLAGPGLAVVAAGPRHRPVAGARPHPAVGHGWRLELTRERLRWEPLGIDLRFGEVPDRLGWPDLLGAGVRAGQIPPGAPRLSLRPSRGAGAGRPASGGSHGRRPGDPGPARGPRGAAVEMGPCPGIGGFGWTGEPPDAGPRAAIAGASPGPVELQVLGVVQAVGAAAPFTSQRALDLACYLALHRDGATPDKLLYWLWRRGEVMPSRKAFANVVSRARVCLGRDAHGEPYLSHVGSDSVYRLSAQVTTDLERFATWRRIAERVPPQQALECLRAALWLVRGAPFGGGSGETFSWADASWRSHVEYLVDSTAHRLADAALELDRLDVARWATLRGIAITPGCDQCYQRRIAAARRSGHRREADLVRRDLDRIQREPIPELDALAAGVLDGMRSVAD